MLLMLPINQPSAQMPAHVIEALAFVNALKVILAQLVNAVSLSFCFGLF